MRERMFHPLFVYARSIMSLVRGEDPAEVFDFPEDEEADSAMRRGGARRQWRKNMGIVVDLAPQVRTICLEAPFPLVATLGVSRHCSVNFPRCDAV